MYGVPYRQTCDDLIAHLQEQLDFLRSHAAAYDNGRHHFAKEISGNLRNMLHGGGALLVQLDQLRSTLRFVDSGGGPIDPSAFVQSPKLLTMYPADDGSWFHPKLRFGNPDLRLQFGEWWEAPVIRDQARNLYSRSDLVRYTANKDGGSHIDPDIPTTYRGLTHGGSLGWEASIDHGPSTPVLDNVALASVRQIAWEVEQTLLEQCPHLIR